MIFSPFLFLGAVLTIPTLRPISCLILHSPPSSHVSIPSRSSLPFRLRQLLPPRPTPTQHLTSLLTHTLNASLFPPYAARITLHHAHLYHGLLQWKEAARCYKVAGWVARRGGASVGGMQGDVDGGEEEGEGEETPKRRGGCGRDGGGGGSGAPDMLRECFFFSFGSRVGDIDAYIDLLFSLSHTPWLFLCCNAHTAWIYACVPGDSPAMGIIRRIARGRTEIGEGEG